MTAQRLHPRVRIVWIVRAVLIAAFLSAPVVGAFYFGYVPQWAPAVVGVGFAVLGVVHAILRYRRWSYEIREDALYLDRGVITQVRTTVPLVRIQHVDSRRGPVERGVGLASCVVYTAGSRGADVRIPGLTPAGASDLREELKRLAIRADGEDAV
ncbi:MAG: PH domain-containing protein [Halorubrum sp.]